MELYPSIRDALLQLFTGFTLTFKVKHRFTGLAEELRTKLKDTDTIQPPNYVQHSGKGIFDFQ